MATQAKIDEVARLKEKFESAVSLVLADYRGVNANEMVELREKFSKEGLEFRVVKDTLARIAADWHRIGVRRRGPGDCVQAFR